MSIKVDFYAQIIWNNQLLCLSLQMERIIIGKKPID